MEERRDEDLGWLLRDARMRKGLTQEALAERAGVSVGTVRDLEQGRSRRPRTRSLTALTDALDLTRQHRVRLENLVRRAPQAPSEPTGPVRISVLGPLAVTRGGQPINLGAGRHRIVLARLALTPGRPVRRDELIQLLWADRPPPSAANVVQTHISRLRRLLEPGQSPHVPPMLALLSAGYLLQTDGDGLDLVAYRSRLLEVRSSTLPPQRAFDLLTAALEMWQGDDPVEDVAELDGDPLVTALVEERVEIAVRLARLGQAVRRQQQILPLLRRLAERHSWHESLHAQLIMALAATGQQAGALQVFDGIRRRLAEQLGIDPGAELLEARQAVLSGRLERRARVVAGGASGAQPWQAPAPPKDFCGRATELQLLEQTIRYSSRGPESEQVTVCVVSGMAGVGKTSLALKAAWALRREFPDGQLYIDLRGADDRPVPVAYALARLLRGLGVEGRAVPEDDDEAAALFRTVQSGRRILVVLDNAHSAAQVRPLLPGPGGNAVLVTSRNRCDGLDSALNLNLPVFSVGEALDFLKSRIGTTRVQNERGHAEALADVCGRLPIALRVIASRLAAWQEVTLAGLLDQLVDQYSGTDPFGMDGESVMASFELSFRSLAPLPAEVFQSAALIPGEVVSAAAVAALLSFEERLAHRALDTLVAENLLQPSGSRHYRYHDLLRLYAVRFAETEQIPVDRSAALDRLYRWYVARAAAAMQLVYADMVRLPVGLDVDGTQFPDVDAAMTWLNEEIGNLVAVVEGAACGEHRARSWQLADQLRGYFFVCGDVVPWLVTGRAGLSAAEAAADIQAQAAMHQTIGQAHWAAGEHHRAADAYRRGISAARRAGWLVGEAYLSHNLGLVQSELGRPDEAQQLYQRALDIGVGPEFDHIRAVTLNDLATLCHERGELTEAVGYLQAAMQMNEGTARRASAMANRSNLGMILRQLEDFDVALEHLNAALAYYRHTGSTTAELSVLDELSQLHAQKGEWVAAVHSASDALQLALRLRNLRAQAATLNTLGFALLGSRAVSDAQDRFSESLAISSKNSYRYFEAQACVGIAETLLLTGDAEKAYLTAGRAGDLAAGNTYRALHGDALLLQAKAAIALGDLDNAAKSCHVAGEVLNAANLPGRIRDCADLQARLVVLISQQEHRPQPWVVSSPDAAVSTAPGSVSAAGPSGSPSPRWAGTHQNQ
ncbi:BTAD domain-containing putative transcriptional regulator [Micromonospora sp. NPDC048830]|uniref:BTAD domain-containing putative transcriptional regulator n=1 Tax=Micromonospora sp. NPDC048830 TaxID=3364257 RepID=UPI00371B0EE4